MTKLRVNELAYSLDWTWGTYGMKGTIEQVSAGFWHGAHGSVLDGQMLTHTMKESAAPLRALQSKKLLVACGQSANSDLPAACSNASFDLDFCMHQDHDGRQYTEIILGHRMEIGLEKGLLSKFSSETMNLGGASIKMLWTTDEDHRMM